MSDPTESPSPRPLALAEIAEILDCDRVGLFLADGDRIPRIASDAFPEERYFSAAAIDLCDRVLVSREVSVVVDRAAHWGYLGAPLVLGTQLFGVLLATRGAGRPAFTGDDGEILQALAERMAIDHQRLRAQELARAEQEAHAANRAKSAFLAHISHEIRTPLNAIIGYSELLEDELVDDGHTRYVADIHRIQGAAKHLLGLINNMLDLSKIEAGKMELYLEAIDVDALLGDAVTTCRPAIERNHNDLVVDVDPELRRREVISDRLKLTQILINLLGNAAKFTRDGTIRLEAWCEGSTLRLQVVDSGIGMTEAQLARLFADYTQASERTASRFGGTGLGLAVTRRLCELMGGSIAVDSVSGRGSSFRVCLPLRIGGDAAAQDRA
ncbi:MAG: ATP-binding protein [Nannocystaceae bacterium]